MKKILLIICLLTSSLSWACSCSKYPLSHDDTIRQLVRNEMGRRGIIDMDKDVTAIKAYPTLIERLDLARMRGTSCEVRGPQNEFLYHCTNRIKYDYLVKTNKCELVVRVKSTFTKVSGKIVSKKCEN